MLDEREEDVRRPEEREEARRAQGKCCCAQGKCCRRPSLEAREGALLMVSSRGGKYGYVPVSRQKAYRRLRAKGKSKKVAAMIANAGTSFSGRSRMARKAARTRRRRGRR